MSIEKKSEVISFRLDHSEYIPIKNLLNDSDLTKSEFMRLLFLKNSDEVIKAVKNKKSTTDKKTLFLISNLSNNLNQIAKKINIDHKNGIVSERTYKLAINRMITIEKHLEDLSNAL